MMMSVDCAIGGSVGTASGVRSRAGIDISVMWCVSSGPSCSCSRARANNRTRAACPHRTQPATSNLYNSVPGGASLAPRSPVTSDSTSEWRFREREMSGRKPGSFLVHAK